MQLHSILDPHSILCFPYYAESQLVFIDSRYNIAWSVAVSSNFILFESWLCVLSAASGKKARFWSLSCLTSTSPTVRRGPASLLREGAGLLSPSPSCPCLRRPTQCCERRQLAAVSSSRNQQPQQHLDCRYPHHRRQAEPHHLRLGAAAVTGLLREERATDG